MVTGLYIRRDSEWLTLKAANFPAEAIKGMRWVDKSTESATKG